MQTHVVPSNSRYLSALHAVHISELVNSQFAHTIGQHLVLKSIIVKFNLIVSKIIFLY